MEADKTIAELGAKLDAWFDGSSEAFASHDRAVQAKALIRGIAIEKEINHFIAEATATLGALLNRQDKIGEQQRVASLIRGFEFGSRFAHALHDQLGDTDSETKVVHLIQDIAETLESIDSGRGALAVLLNHPDVGVRASAAASLVNSIPDRAVPVLREIDQKEGGTSADFTAHWALLAWQLKQKANANKAD